MAAITDVRMVNNNDSNQFLFRAVTPFQNKKSQQAIDIPFINTSAANRVLFRFSGQAQDIAFNFVLFDDGVDVSNGTNGGTPVVTVTQQIQYLMDTFFGDNYDVDWTMYQSKHFGSSISGVITDISIDQPAGAGTAIPCSIVFKRGRIGAL